LYQIFWV